MNRFAAPTQFCSIQFCSIQFCKSTVSILLCMTLCAGGAIPAHAAKGESAHKLFVDGQTAE